MNGKLHGDNCYRVKNDEKTTGQFINGDPVRCTIYKDDILLWLNYSELNGNKYGPIILCSNNDNSIQYTTTYWHNGTQIAKI